MNRIVLLIIALASSAASAQWSGTVGGTIVVTEGRVPTAAGFIPAYPAANAGVVHTHIQPPVFSAGKADVGASQGHR
jgi:hypothetical protein